MICSSRSSRACPPNRSASSGASPSTGSASSTTPTIAKSSPKHSLGSSTPVLQLVPTRNPSWNHLSTSPVSRGAPAPWCQPLWPSCPSPTTAALRSWTAAMASSSAGGMTPPPRMAGSVTLCAIQPRRSGSPCRTPAKPPCVCP
jgi:hypothetical protein